MKKILLMVCLLFMCVGCTNINNMNYKDIIEDTIKDNKDNKIYNEYHSGYKYYLPKYMSNQGNYDYNEKITSNNYNYYLYVDLISYYNKVKINFKDDDDYISYAFKFKNNYGYLSINEEENKYLVEIIYNYAKIEVLVNKEDINYSIYNSIVLLSTIKYNDEVINNLIGDNVINSSEEILNIFGNQTKDDDFIDIIEEYDNYDDKETTIPDYDVIN